MKARGARGFFVSLSSEWTIHSGKHFLFFFHSSRIMFVLFKLRFLNRKLEEIIDHADTLTGNVCEDNEICWVMCLYEYKSEEIQYHKVLPSDTWSGVRSLIVEVHVREQLMLKYCRLNDFQMNRCNILIYIQYEQGDSCRRHQSHIAVHCWSRKEASEWSLFTSL